MGWAEIVRKRLILRIVIRIHVCPWDLADIFGRQTEAVSHFGNYQIACVAHTGREPARDTNPLATHALCSASEKEVRENSAGLRNESNYKNRIGKPEGQLAVRPKEFRAD